MSIHSKNVNLVSDKEKIDSSTPQGKLMITMIAAIYEFERTNMLERQREGIAIAKREGKYKGGQVKKIDQELFSKLYSKYLSRKLTKVQFAKRLGVSRPTLDRILAEIQEK